MSSKQNIVVLFSGTRISPFIKYLLESRKVKFTIIANSLLDYKVSSDPKNKNSAGGWIDMELLSIASSLIPDDLRQSPLASLFTKSKMISVVPLSPSSQFTATWLSDIRLNTETAHEETNHIFKTLSNYKSYPVEVFPLSFDQKSPITIKYRNQSGSPRVYQNFGYLDFQKRTEIDADSLDSAITSKKDFSISDYDPGESIISAEIEKILKDADSIIISSNDLFSLAVMLSYKDLRKSIKKSQGSVLSISPIGARFSLDPKELALIKAFGFTPDFNGYLDILKDVADTICLDSGDSDIAIKAQESGFNVVLEDLFNVENKTDFLTLILKSAGVDVSTFVLDETVGVSKKEPKSSSDNLVEEEKKIIEKDAEQTTVSIASAVDKPSQTEEKLMESISVKNKPDIKVSKEKNDEIISSEEVPIQETKNSQSSKIAKSITIAKSVKKSTTDAKEDELDSKRDVKSRESDQLSKKVNTSENLDDLNLDSESIADENLVEFYNDSMKLLEEDKIDDLSAWIKDIESYIEKDEGHAIKVANSIISVLKQTSKERVKSNAIQSFLELSIERKIQFKNTLLLWIVTHLDDPDFSIQNLQYDTIKRMVLYEDSSELIGEFLKSLIKHLLTSSDMTPAKQERGRVLVLRIAFNNRILTKYAIRAFIDIFDDDKVEQSNLWPGLSSFSARMVGIELVEGYTVTKSKIISEEANKKELGSFSILLDEIITSWEKGDMNNVLSLCGGLSESALRKAKRLSLAQKIKKVGTVPLEVLAKSLDEDPKELETLVYEMVMNDDISAKLEIVDSRLYIMPIDEEKQEIEDNSITESLDSNVDDSVESNVPKKARKKLGKSSKDKGD